jgi:hypothetical protein
MSELRVPLDAVTDAGGPEPKPSSATSPTPTFASSTPVTRPGDPGRGDRHRDRRVPPPVGVTAAYRHVAQADGRLVADNRMVPPGTWPTDTDEEPAHVLAAAR